MSRTNEPSLEECILKWVEEANRPLTPPAGQVAQQPDEKAQEVFFQLYRMMCRPQSDRGVGVVPPANPLPSTYIGWL